MSKIKMFYNHFWSCFGLAMVNTNGCTFLLHVLAQSPLLAFLLAAAGWAGRGQPEVFLVNEMCAAM